MPYANRDYRAIYFKIVLNVKLKLIEMYSTLICHIVGKAKGVKIGSKVRFFGSCYFFRASASTIQIGNNVTLRSDRTSNLIGVTRRCIISTLERGADIRIGNNTGLSGVSIGASNKIQIGDNVLIGANSTITDNNWHNIDPASRELHDTKKGQVIIGNNVFIGYGCIILKNAQIGDNSVIGAGSVVASVIPANVIASGNPCKVLKEL